MSGPSAQKPSSTGDGVDRRHRPAVGTLQATPTVTVGATMAVATKIERPKVTVGTDLPVGTGAGRWAQPLRCHGAVYAVPTVAHGATSAVGPEPDNWVPSPIVPTVAHGTTSAGKKLGREVGQMEAWTHMKVVTPGPNEPRPAPEMYYGKAKESKEKYCEEYAKLHPEVEDPMTEPVDEVAMMRRGAAAWTSCLPCWGFQASEELHADQGYPPLRQLRYLADYMPFSGRAYEEYLEKIKEHDLVRDAYAQWTSNQMASFTRFWSARGTTPRAASSGADASVPVQEGVLLHVQASASVDPGIGRIRERHSLWYADAPRSPFSWCFCRTSAWFCFRWLSSWFYLPEHRRTPVTAGWLCRRCAGRRPPSSRRRRTVPTVTCYADGERAAPDAICADEKTPTVTVGRDGADGAPPCADGAGPSAHPVSPVVNLLRKKAFI
ncbi:hypothetical protein QYE76_020285 [Lolium multiflorum]|uniref:Uncharacterized protein n=1 Tax=Lolium multiflorum TaxID=4521 RepID=A0AAD8R4J1_LOLMU|nr:hypothetical protein QYE76_020285 [Lolium multiflorum]